MFIRRRKHDMPGLNTTATADISFMLLVFFLVTTSMGVDKGLRRQLPPLQQQENKEKTIVERSHLMTLEITPDNQIMMDNQPILLSDINKKVGDFVTRIGKDHVISIKAADQSDYQTYFSLQNELVEAYQNVRNQMAIKRYGRPLNACTPQQRQTILDNCPQRIAESFKENSHDEFSP